MENINLIRKIAWSFHNTTGIDWEELYSEASLAYAEGLEHGKHPHNPDKGKLSTYMWGRITNHLNDWIKKQPSYKYAYHNNGNTLNFVDWNVTDFTVEQNHFWKSLTEEAQEIANIVLETPELFDSISAEEAKKRVSEILQEKGVKLSRIWCGIKELKLALV